MGGAGNGLDALEVVSSLAVRLSSGNSLGVGQTYSLSS